MDLTTIIAILGFVVALIGGIPGILEIRNKWKRSAFEVLFDKENSLACFVRSPIAERKGKLAILLYRVTVVGKGSSPSFLSKIQAHVQCNGKNILGSQFHPFQFSKTDKEGIAKEAICISIGASPKPDRLFLGDWSNFKPGSSGLEYGQPLSFSTAFCFDVSSDEYANCKSLKIELFDYHGTGYRKKIRNFVFKPEYIDFFLMEFDQEISD